MMNAAPLVYAAVSVGSLVALWFVYSILYRWYRVDYLRQELFAVRDDLFELAALGQLKFDDEAYTLLRATLNGFIRFAHRLNFLGFVIFVVDIGDNVDDSFEVRFNSAVDRLEPAAQSEVRALYRRMHERLLSHMLATSPTLQVTLFVLVAIEVVKAFARGARSTTTSAAEWVQNRRPQWVDAMDVAAFEYGVAA